jgi:hypothetical protein
MSAFLYLVFLCHCGLFTVTYGARPLIYKADIAILRTRSVITTVTYSHPSHMRAHNRRVKVSLIGLIILERVYVN